jgi:glycine dehydrogenase subunit 2
VGVKKELAKFLPGPRIIKKEGGRFGYDYNCPSSVGKIHPFYGNWGVLLRAYCYILLMGNDLKKVSERAVLNANYLKKKVLEKGYYEEPYPGVCKHEFVLSCSKLEKEKGIRASDVSKRILDWNAHPPTVYFPLIVKECLMIEPTESEPKRELDNYANLLNRIAEEKEEIVKNAPHQTPVGRVDEVLAARYPKLTWNDLDRTDFEDEAQG